MNKIILHLNNDDEPAALHEFNRQWEQFPWPSRYFTLLFPTASSSLELKFPSPHGLKYHYTLFKICENLTGLTVKFLLERYLGYLIRRPKLLSFEPPKSVTPPSGKIDIRQALLDSLKTNSFSNALNYLLALREKEGYSAASDELLKICLRNTGALGHNFTCPLGMINSGLISERINEPAALYALLDYTFKNLGGIETPLHLSSRPFSDILTDAVHAPGILGHNLIFASAIEKHGDRTGGEYRTHLSHALDLDIAASPMKYDRAFPDDLPAEKHSSRPSGSQLADCLYKGDLNKAVSIISAILEFNSSGSDLFETMIVLMACVDNYQPHYYTYPFAVKELAEKHPELARQLYCGWAGFILEEAGNYRWIEKTGTILRTLFPA